MFKNIIKKEPEIQARIIEPLVNIKEDDSEVVLEAYMSGVDKDNINVDLEDNQLTIIGKQKNEDAPKGYTALYRERCPFEYQRRFVLNFDVDRDKVTAKYDKGVLELRLPKIEIQHVKKITIQ